MAGKKHYGRSQRKKNYLIPELINDVSHTFNERVLLSRDWDPELTKAAVLEAWESSKAQLFKKCEYNLVDQADARIKQAFDEHPPEQWFETVNEVVDGYRRQSDVARSKARRDILCLWHEIAYGEDRGRFDMPWLRGMTDAEKLAPYINKGERYVFGGFTNQAILNVAASANRKSQETVVLFWKELEKLLAHDFEPDPESKQSTDRQKRGFVLNKIKGIPSMTSVFVPNLRTVWLNPDGSRWEAPEGRNRPTQQEIADQGLASRQFRDPNNPYFSYPVWSVTDVEHLMTAPDQQAVAELRSLRQPKAQAMLEAEGTDLDQLVDQLIEQQIDQHSIEVGTHSEQAFYAPMADRMAIPTKEQFRNPVLRYATFSHELAHSTKHLLGRSPFNKKGSVPYAQEEMIAESCAHLRVKDLQETLTERCEGRLPENWQAYFDDYYENALSYTQGWGSRFEFSDLFDQLIKAEKMLESKSLLTNMMSDVVDAVSLIKTGEFNGEAITPERRREAMMANKNEHAPTEGYKVGIG